MQHIALIEYGVGNILSVRRALERAADGSNASITVSANPEIIAKADAIVLPGVGHFRECARRLRAQTGLIAAMEHAVFARGAPFLGICVGMQLLTTRGEEDGSCPGLGWIDGESIALSTQFRIPHMGWNTVEKTHGALFDGIAHTDMYFAHAYAVSPSNPAHVCAVCDYGGSFTAAIAMDSIFGVQFHPEKSQDAGLTLLTNFIRIAS